MIEQFNKLPLSELFESVIGGGTPPRAIPEYWNGSIPWASVKDFSDNELKLNKTQESITKLGLLNSTSKLIKTGTPIICLRMAVGRVAIANKDVSINQDLKALFTKGNIDSLYLVYLLDFSRSEVMRRSIGSTVKGISTSELLRIQVPFPESLDTQQKIATILSTVDNLIENTQSLIDKYTAVKQGMMADLFTRGIDLSGTSETNKNYGQLRPSITESPELYQETELGWVAKDWKVDKLENLTTKIIDGTHYTPTYTVEGVPFLRVTDVQSKEINLEKIKFISEEEHKLLIKRCNPEIGDILYSKNGTIGIPKIVNWNWKFSVFVSLCLIKPNHKKINNKYLELVLTSTVAWTQIRVRAKQGTVTNLHLEEIREFLIPLPSFDEQTAIVDRAITFQNRIDGEKSYLEKLRNEKKGLMQDLLTGKVRVKID